MFGVPGLLLLERIVLMQRAGAFPNSRGFTQQWQYRLYLCQPLPELLRTGG